MVCGGYAHHPAPPPTPYNLASGQPIKGKPGTGINAAALSRDDRPGHPRAREPHAPTMVTPANYPVSLCCPL